MQSWIVIREAAELPWLLSRTLGVWGTLTLPVYFCFFLSSLPPSFFPFLLFSLSFSRVGNYGLKMARWSWQILAPDQSLNDLSIKSLPCLFKFHKVPLKGSPKQIVLNPWERCCGWMDTHISRSHFFCSIQCVDTDHKFKQDKSDNDECVNSGPDTGQTLLCLIFFFPHTHKKMHGLFFYAYFTDGKKLDSEVKLFVPTTIFRYRWSSDSKETITHRNLTTVEVYLFLTS